MYVCDAFTQTDTFPDAGIAVRRKLEEATVATAAAAAATAAIPTENVADDAGGTAGVDAGVNTAATGGLHVAVPEGNVLMDAGGQRENSDPARSRGSVLSESGSAPATSSGPVRYAAVTPGLTRTADVEMAVVDDSDVFKVAILPRPANGGAPGNGQQQSSSQSDGGAQQKFDGRPQQQVQQQRVQQQQQQQQAPQ